MSDEFGNTVDAEVWVPTHNHTMRGIRPSGQCPACDGYTPGQGNWIPVPVCYTRHEPMPGVHQDVPHSNSQCMDTRTPRNGG